MVEEGASPDAKSVHGQPAVYMAARNGHTAAVEALLRLGADPNAASPDGATALMCAANCGHAACARLLLEAGADATLRTTGGGVEGKTALLLRQLEGGLPLQAAGRGPQSGIAPRLQQQPGALGLAVDGGTHERGGAVLVDLGFRSVGVGPQPQQRLHCRRVLV